MFKWKARRQNTVEATFSSKNQATIPKAVRDHLHLKSGDRLKFFFNPMGLLQFCPASPYQRLKAASQYLSDPFRSRKSLELSRPAQRRDSADAKVTRRIVPLPLDDSEKAAIRSSPIRLPNHIFQTFVRGFGLSVGERFRLRWNYATDKSACRQRSRG